MDKANEAAIPRTSIPVIGGALSIASASITILFVLIVFLIEYIRYFSGEISFPPGSTYFLAFGGLRIFWLVAGMLAITGGISAIKRRNWKLSLFGVIASIFCIPIIPGIVATQMVAKSKNEFGQLNQ